MQVTSAKVTRTEGSALRTMRSVRRTTAVTFLALGLLLVSSFACGGPAQGDGKQGGTGSSTDVPELTDDTIHERINDARVRDVPPENGVGPPISWSFQEYEPKEITVVEKQVDGTRATLVLDIKTTSQPGARTPRSLAGQIRTEWRLETGWVLRRWEIERTENISMKYKDLAPPPGANSNNNLPPPPPAANSNADQGRRDR